MGKRRKLSPLSSRANHNQKGLRTPTTGTTVLSRAGENKKPLGFPGGFLLDAHIQRGLILSKVTPGV